MGEVGYECFLSSPFSRVIVLVALHLSQRETKAFQDKGS